MYPIWLRIPLVTLKTYMFKLEHHAQLMSLRCGIQLCYFSIRIPALAHSKQIMRTKGALIHLPEIFMQHRSVVYYTFKRLFSYHLYHVHTESAYALIYPEIHHIINITAHIRIFPVQICLLYTEHMKIILSAFLIVLPCAVAP